MKKKLFAMLLVIVMILAASIPAVSAANTALDTAQKVSFTVACSKPGYEFTVYKVADLVTTTSPYQTKYNSLVTSISDAVTAGDTEALLTALDADSSLAGASSAGTYKVANDGAQKIFTDLPQGIYYVRATNYPANVKSVTNSVFALPYYTSEDGWVYELGDTIALAAKVNESEPGIEKIITNSTQGNVNYTDVSLGDTVNFEIRTDTMGLSQEVATHDFKLSSYVISDKMSKGLTLDNNSFEVKLIGEDGTASPALKSKDDYAVDITASEGSDTLFTVSLTPAILAKDDFYKASKVSVTYSAVLNKYAVTTIEGNPNEATSLTYANKTGVSSTVEGNTVYVYTYGLQVNKLDEKGAPLAGADFALYKTEADAADEKNAIATGTSDKDGVVKFYNSDKEEMKLQSGRYFIKETKAPTGYNRYTEIIGAGNNPVKIDVTYGNSFINNTYVTSAPKNGVAVVSVTNTKTILPQTGGEGNTLPNVIAVVFALLALMTVSVYLLNKRRSKKSADTK